MNILDEIVSFGKYKGYPWREVDFEYLDWIVVGHSNPEIIEKANRVIDEKSIEYDAYDREKEWAIAKDMISEESIHMSDEDVAAGMKKPSGGDVGLEIS